MQALAYCIKNCCCSAWTNCSSTLPENCTFDDTVVEAYQYLQWYYLIGTGASYQQYFEAIDSVRHLCTNIFPGMF